MPSLLPIWTRVLGSVLDCLYQPPGSYNWSGPRHWLAHASNSTHLPRVNCQVHFNHTDTQKATEFLKIITNLFLRPLEEKYYYQFWGHELIGVVFVLVYNQDFKSIVDVLVLLLSANVLGTSESLSCQKVSKLVYNLSSK